MKSNPSDSKATRSTSRADRRKQTRRRRWFSVGFLAAILLSSPLWAARVIELLSDPLTEHWVEFDLQKVTVNGLHQLTTDSIFVIAEIPNDISSFECNPDVIRQRLENHPWIRSASVFRKLPGELILNIVEREPVAVLRGTSVVLLTSDGFVLPAPSAQWVWEMPMITPPTAMTPHVGMKTSDKTVLAMLSQLNTATAASADIISNISEFFVRDNELYATMIQPPLTIRLGSGANALSWTALQKLIVDERDVFWARSDITIDLRMDGSIVVSQEETKQESENSLNQESTKA